MRFLIYVWPCLNLSKAWLTQLMMHGVQMDDELDGSNLAITLGES